ncbi:MAG: bacterial Ig-like domain-containing protein [Oscillospiraceae bacterium]
MSNKSRIAAVTEQIKANNVAITNMKTKLGNLAQVTATPADVAAGKVFVLPTGATASGTAMLSKPEQTKTLTLAMASGDQTIAPDSGKVLTAVTVTKPATLLPENIKQGVNIGGVLGTLMGAVGVVLSSIAITTPPTKLIYNGGDAFDPAGMVVTATYSNGATRVVTGCTYAPSAITVSGNVTVSFTEFGVTKTAVVAVTKVQAYVPQEVYFDDYENAFKSFASGIQPIKDSIFANPIYENNIPYYPMSLIIVEYFGYHKNMTSSMLQTSQVVVDAFISAGQAMYTKAGSFNALFKDVQYKQDMLKCLTEFKKFEAVGLISSFSYNAENFTFTMVGSQAVQKTKTGNIYELFFNAMLA